MSRSQAQISGGASLLVNGSPSGSDGGSSLLCMPPSHLMQPLPSLPSPWIRSGIVRSPRGEPLPWQSIFGLPLFSVAPTHRTPKSRLLSAKKYEYMLASSNPDCHQDPRCRSPWNLPLAHQRSREPCFCNNAACYLKACQNGRLALRIVKRACTALWAAVTAVFGNVFAFVCEAFSHVLYVVAMPAMS
jgi:hypothetical protein